MMPSWEISFFFSLPPPESLIMPCRAHYDLRHVSHDVPSVCPAMTEGPASSHSCQTAPSLTSDCRYLYIKTMPCQSELVCPSPWVEPCHYFTQAQERRMLFSTCFRKCNIGAQKLQALKRAGFVGVWLLLAIRLWCDCEESSAQNTSEHLVNTSL